MDGEPEIQIDDIQGHIIPGFGTAHTVVVGLRLVDPLNGRRALRQLIPCVTSARVALGEKDARRLAFTSGREFPSMSAPMLAIMFSGSALRAWGVGLDGFDRSFRSGMRSDAETLKDPVGSDGVPSDWRFARDDATRVDVLLVGGHNDKGTLEDVVAKWITSVAPALAPVVQHFGRRRDGDQEFFGFRDGTSQPAIRGVDADGVPISRRVIEPSDPRANSFAKPGQRLVWPGLFLFGYPNETSVPLKPGSTRVPPAGWMNNGSYLVFRVLRQEVEAFGDAVGKLEQYLQARNENVPAGWVAAKLVGRWPDGTPLVASPGFPNGDISDNPDRINNFSFASSTAATPLASGATALPAVGADPLGKACPFIAHIRKVNPRDGSSEIGAENHAQKLILRRGTTFGPELGEVGTDSRGLLFLSYQTSIVDQFLFLQENWANSSTRPSGGGIDPIIGQDGTLDPKRKLRFFGPSGAQVTCPFDGRWVIAEGGDYFVAPGLLGLDALLADLPRRPLPKGMTPPQVEG